MATNPKPYPQLARDRIKTSKIITRLQKHALGEEGMKASEITAARILLDKTVPNLAQVQQDVTITNATADSVSDAILEHIATGGSAGASRPAQSPRKPTGVH